MLCLVLKFGKTDFFRLTIEKFSWKRKGNCPSYSWTDPMSVGFDTSYISRTCTLQHETLESCSIEGKWNISSINRVLVEIETKTTRCASLRRNSSSCHENMTVLVFNEKNALLTKKIIPKEKVPVDTNYFSHKDSFYIDDLTGVNYITARFIANRSCGELVQVAVSHYECSAVKRDLMEISAVLAPDKYTNTIIVKGMCKPNAVSKPNSETPFMSCEYMGIYTIVGYCICMKGFVRVDNSCKSITIFTCFYAFVYKGISLNFAANIKRI